MTVTTTKLCKEIKYRKKTIEICFFVIVSDSQWKQSQFMRG